MIDRDESFLDRRQGRNLRQRRPAHEHDPKAESARRCNFAVGRRTPAVAREYDLDAVLQKKCALVGFEEGPALCDVACIGERRRRIGKLDAPYQIIMLGRGLELGELLAAECKENPARCFTERLHGLFDILHLDPMITGNARPGRPAQSHKRNVCCRCGASCVDRDLRRVRMRGIDEDIDACAFQIMGEPVCAAKTANAHRHVLWRGLLGAPGEREYHGNMQTRCECAGKRARFGRASENEDVSHGDR